MRLSGTFYSYSPSGRPRTDSSHSSGSNLTTLSSRRISLNIRSLLGAVQIRVATELLEIHLGTSFTLRTVSDLKFMASFIPEPRWNIHSQVWMRRMIVVKVELSVRSEEKVYSRMSLEYSCADCPSVASPGLLNDLKTCVIVPVYNNAGTIKDIVQRTLKVLQRCDCRG